jgi:hypothetical protein
VSTRRVLWASRDDPGHEWCELATGPDSSRISGTAVLSAAGTPWRITYAIDLDDGGRTRRVHVAADGPRTEPIIVELAADGLGRWTHPRSGEVVVNEPDALDVDLGFSPATNALPIRRLGLAVGERREIAVCWVRFPSFEVTPGRQVYERVGERAWRYRSGGFEADLTVDADGFVETYADWREVAAVTIPPGRPNAATRPTHRRQ